MSKKKEEKKKPWWEKTLIVLILVALIGGFWQFILPKIWDLISKKPVAKIQYNVSETPLLEVIKNVEGETDHDIIASREVEEFKISGRFQGEDWLQVLIRILRTYDKQLKYDIDEKNKKIKIELRTKAKP